MGQCARREREQKEKNSNLWGQARLKLGLDAGGYAKTYELGSSCLWAIFRLGWGFDVDVGASKHVFLCLGWCRADL